MSRLASTSRVSLEDWDALAGLTARENESIARMQDAIQSKSLPLSAQPLELLKNRAARDDSPAGSPRPSSAHGSTGADTEPVSRPIATTQQFHEYFSAVSSSLEQEQEEVYRLHLRELDGHIQTCSEIVESLEASRGLLSEMQANYRFVEDNSRALQGACETMLDDQKHLVEMGDAIGARLEYFKELESATKMLNLPGEALVLEDDFLNMLDRLDVCLEFLKINRDFKDSEIYLIRFQQCLTRSMTLIKMYFVSVVRRLANEVSDKMGAQDLSETALSALLYTKFTNVSTTLRVLIFELEKRARVEPAEYSSLLNECYAAWFAARTALLSGSLSEEVRRMDPGGSDLIKLARAGCNHLRSISMGEWALYKELFSTGETELYQYLESLCDNLYDSLRPRILHEPKLEVLCELCTVLGAMMALDAEGGIADDSDEEGDSFVGMSTPTRPGHRSAHSASSIMTTTELGSKRPIPLGRLRFSVLLQTILQDTQTRLVFRAQAVIQAEVLRYVPTPDELAYPAILQAQTGAEGDRMLWEDDDLLASDRDGGFRAPREEVQVTWFATLRRTVWVLSRLHTYVNNAIFQDFAAEAVTLCRQSLAAASLQIALREGNARIDGQLFLIRHLLILKEMIRSVDLGRVERGVDFSSVTDALYNLLRNTSVILNPNALYELASRGIPSFAETMTDAKMELDQALKASCESLISSSSTDLTAPLSSFLALCASYLSSTNATVRDLATQKGTSAEEVLAVHQAFMERSGLEDSASEGQERRGAREIVWKLRVYLRDETTIKVLLPPLLDEVVDSYTTFYNLVRSEYDFSTSSSLVTPIVLREKLDKATI